MIDNGRSRPRGIIDQREQSTVIGLLPEDEARIRYRYANKDGCIGREREKMGRKMKNKYYFGDACDARDHRTDDIAGRTAAGRVPRTGGHGASIPNELTIRFLYAHTMPTIFYALYSCFHLDASPPSSRHRAESVKRGFLYYTFSCAHCYRA